METDTLEKTTTRLRRLLREKVPDLLLQAECGGDLELPTPLPWGFASIPSLRELADIAEQELEEFRALQNRSFRHQSNPRLDEQRSGGSLSDASCKEDLGLHEQQQHDEEQQGHQRTYADVHEHPQDQQSRIPEVQTRPGRQVYDGQSDAGCRRESLADHWSHRTQLEAHGEAEAGDRDLGQECLTEFLNTQGCSAGGPDEDCGEGRMEDESGTGREPTEAAAKEAGGIGVATGPLEAAAGEGYPAIPVDGEGVGEDTGRDQQAAFLRGTDDPAALHDSASAVPRKPYACRALVESLVQSRAFRSPHCEGAMAEAMGMMDLYDGLAGSTLGPPPGRRELEAFRGLLKEHINSRWALEAVKQGVAAAKQGNYVDAHKAYARALELDPGSAEAYVARGAAHANQRAFADAERDLRRALELDPGHRNATTYLDAVLRHVAERQQQLEALEEERQQVLTQQQQQQQRDTRWQTVPEAGGVAAGLREGGPVLWAAQMPGSVAGGGGRAAGQEVYNKAHGPPPSQGRLQRDFHSNVAPESSGMLVKKAEGRRRCGSDASDRSTENSGSSSSSGSSSDGTPGRGLGQGGPSQPASDDIRRALEVVLKAQKHKKKSKHKKHKKKHKKSKRRRRD